jgi:hypothetical protein
VCGGVEGSGFGYLDAGGVCDCPAGGHRLCTAGLPRGCISESYVTQFLGIQIRKPIIFLRHRSTYIFLIRILLLMNQ